jgi:hypothetical protein
MFKVTTSPSYIVPVEVTLPGDTNKQTFDIDFKRLTKTEIDDLKERIRTNKVSDREICHDLVLGWAGIKGSDGDLEFTVGNLDAVLNIHPVEAAVITAFFASINGARVKN